MIQYEIISRGSSHEPFKPQLASGLSLFDHFVVLAFFAFNIKWTKWP